MINFQQAEKMVADLEIYAVKNGRVEGTWNLYSGHVYNVAKIAKKIADFIGMDSKRASVMALLHDIGKIDEGLVSRFHGIIGYEMLKDKDYDIARICLTHMFPNNIIPSWESIGTRLFFNNKKDYDFTSQYLQDNPPNDYDLLIQLSDTLGKYNKFATIEESIIEYRTRHNIKESDGIVQNAIASRTKVKQYFDKKIGQDVYDFLEIKHK